MNLRHVLGSGLLGFVLGAFAVASLQNAAAVRRGNAAVEKSPVAGASDGATTPAESPAATSGHVPVPAPSRSTVTNAAPPAGTPSPADAERELQARDLLIPVQGVNASQLTRSFTDARTGHEHDAIDILAPRNTPVLAVEDGTIAKLFVSKLGGNTIYQFDPSQRFCYYYAHLERYADGLKEGQSVRRGQIIGYVGTSGNAPPETPHLHFAISILNPDHHWWEGTAIDPYDALAR
ncbi:MAG TPA: peptidoglycan DD-metalloendopeptidase family protein [Vicinamibacterales bacterium]|jgi:murein DD-endopeptidase MepM/ murein hydrolase activator NlpD|nr:peptidoglycan DD-metalloendopeptidase family protein [Vicinamibacterales bacterium]